MSAVRVMVAYLRDDDVMRACQPLAAALFSSPHHATLPDGLL